MHSRGYELDPLGAGLISPALLPGLRLEAMPPKAPSGRQPRQPRKVAGPRCAGRERKLGSPSRRGDWWSLLLRIGRRTPACRCPLSIGRPRMTGKPASGQCPMVGIPTAGIARPGDRMIPSGAILKSSCTAAGLHVVKKELRHGFGRRPLPRQGPRSPHENAGKGMKLVQSGCRTRIPPSSRRRPIANRASSLAPRTIRRIRPLSTRCPNSKVR